MYMSVACGGGAKTPGAADGSQGAPAPLPPEGRPGGGASSPEVLWCTPCRVAWASPSRGWGPVGVPSRLLGEPPPLELDCRPGTVVVAGVGTGAERASTTPGHRSTLSECKMLSGRTATLTRSSEGAMSSPLRGMYRTSHS